MPQTQIFKELNTLWDKVASVSDKAAIKVLVAIVIASLLYQNNTDDGKSELLRDLLENESKAHNRTKIMLLDRDREINELYVDKARQKDTIIAILMRGQKK